MEVVGSLIFMAKFQWAAHSVAHVQLTGNEVGSCPGFLFRMGHSSDSLHKTTLYNSPFREHIYVYRETSMSGSGIHTLKQR